MTWEDAKLDVEYDGPPEKAESTIILTACGFLVRQNSREIVICLDIDPLARDVRFTFAIPRKMVLKLQELVIKDAPENT